MFGTLGRGILELALPLKTIEFCKWNLERQMAPSQQQQLLKINSNVI